MTGSDKLTESGLTTNKPSSALRIRQSSLSLCESSSGMSGNARILSKILVNVVSTTCPIA